MSYKPSPSASASTDNEIYRDAVPSPSPNPLARQLAVDENSDEHEVLEPSFKFERVMGANEL